MLFLLKRTWPVALAATVVLTLLGIGLRLLLHDGPEIRPSLSALLLGVEVFLVVLTSDVVLHGLFCLLFGDRYRKRHRELAAVFRGQKVSAILAGALMAGTGEELLFRGLGTSPLYLIGAAVAFGLLHHIRPSLWPFTLWAVWQGLLIAAGIYLTGNLAVTMTAHFLHDLTGFFLFRYLNGPPPA